MAANGRFFGEEGTYFFAYAWHLPGWRALLHPLGGYLNIIASSATLLACVLVKAGLIPLDAAPRVTFAVSLALQCCPAVLVLTARAPWLASRGAILACLASLLLTPAAEEVWLQTLHSQFHLTVCVAIMAVTAPARSAPAALFRLTLLVLAPLSGPGNCVLAPVLLVRAALDRSTPRTLEAFAICAATVLQLALFYTASTTRSLHIDPTLLAGVLTVRQGVLLLGGTGAAAAAVDLVRSSGVVLALDAAVLVVLALAMIKSWRSPATWLAAMGLGLSAVSAIGALHPDARLLLVGYGERYAYAPNTLLGLAAVALWRTVRPEHTRVALIGVLWLIGLGLIDRLRPITSLDRGADWRVEAGLWRQDPQHRLRIWPDGWTVDLAPDARPCRGSAQSASEPEFCDGAWERSEAERARGGPNGSPLGKKFTLIPQDRRTPLRISGP